MNVLLVHAHPNPRSFNAALRDTAIRTLGQAGHSLLLSDLYAMRFNPVLSLEELMGEPQEVEGEMEKVRRVDLLLFLFPMWWYGMPAIMKGWIDRVFAYGFAHDEEHSFENGLLKGKKALLCLTTGTRAAYYQEAPERNLMRVLEPIHYGIFAYCGMEVLPPFIAYGPAEMSEAERRATLEAFRVYLQGLPELKPLRFSHDSL
ncbi:MAG: NAD(P)H-dependent oxidoreductase [Meiothermus sp.]|uniref:NAD(P)H-dependent oxidoreductase n=1 Tax=Meiothermus sp. TaxID=1955249 RepID=UPI0025EC6664|nr:NAD(P)H-dependent oxidoreductase [Meiothermus sp.]MCS7057532.1 NAD(P)H-dependent oxidoreductase [Meiothermus sp.]MCS7193721.1 NAD(P)H-dependent oxidoreductase [Meiothermus sp.]MCX7740008.1 NAD(P)H-dependent oxidoreductase [Meiothermus sp.]MDW8089924.1 NAD(P)H-dependent oxidoreductase [Meiothermus sp.]MDW8481651.1 NAD(P)H-dependent oxidoreductase [Meiothermus sp.]